MTDYKRFVAYVYEYQKGKKGNNCGFVKVESRNGNCLVELHLRCPGLIPRIICGIYGFVRKQGLLDSYLLGTCETSDGAAECTLQLQSESLNKTGISLQQLGGMIFKTENGAFFGTEWDDQQIRPENFREIRSKEEIKDTEADTKNIKNDTISENLQESIVDMEKELEVECQTEQDSEPSESIQSQSIPEQERRPAFQIKIGEPFEPFSDGEIISCRKIHPRDMMCFSRCDCSLRGNRFLTYGYYHFGHLLLGRKKSGHYILGVPGGYNQQECFMANMFGFPYFKESKEIELSNIKGGYWYRLINTPNFY